MDINERIGRINELDLEPIKFKLVNGDGESGWTVAEADRVEVEYKRFLVLNLKNQITKRVKSIVPTREVDKFWHAHILDTMKYVVDCEFCFGFFLHHFPYLGLRGLEDAEALQDGFRESLEYYRIEFDGFLMVEGVERTGALESFCTSEPDPSQCAPEPSCSGEPDPTVAPYNRPVLTRG